MYKKTQKKNDQEKHKKDANFSYNRLLANKKHTNTIKI